MADLFPNLVLSVTRLLELAVLGLACGLGLYAWIVPPSWRQPLLTLPLCIGLGFAATTLAALSAVYFEVPLRLVTPGVLALSAVMVAAKAIRAPGQAIEVARQAVRAVGAERRSVGLTLLFAAVALWPSLKIGGDQPFRVGIDEAGYSTTAQYLRDGGTRTKLGREIIQETGQPTLEKALASHMTALRTDILISTDFLLKAQRYGYAGFLASTAKFIGVKRVVTLQMLCLFFSVWLSLSVAAVFLESDLRMPRNVALGWAAALALNCNLLDTLWEGMHSEVFTAAFAAIVYRFWWRSRRPSEKPLKARILNQETALASVAVGTIVAAYFEQALMLGAMGAAMVVIDIFAHKRRFELGNVPVIAAAVAGALLTGGYFIEWFSILFRHISNLSHGGGGFWQPQWGSPVDILGYLDIYWTPVTYLVGHSMPTLILIGLVSLVLVEATIVFLWRRPVLDRAYWLAPMAVIAGIFVKSVFKDLVFNYNYMKTYTMLSFPLICLHAFAMLHFGRYLASKTSGWSFPLRLRWYIFPGWIALVGILFIGRYCRDDSSLPRGVAALDDPALKSRLENCVFLTGMNGPYLENVLLASRMHMPWLNLGWADPYLGPFEGHPIYLFVFRRDFPNLEVSDKLPALVYSNADIAIFDTGLKVKLPPEQAHHEPLKPLSAENPESPVWESKRSATWMAVTSSLVFQ